MADRREQVRQLNGLVAPILVVCWLVGYLAPWLPSGSETAWLALSTWGAAHGVQGLETSTRIVTIVVTVCAVLGATLRLTYIAGRQSRLAARQLGLFATCAPLSIVMPSGGAAFFVTVLFVVAIAGTAINSSVVEELPFPRRLLRESFPILAATCFLILSWQYNAQWVTRGLLIAAGTALLSRALLPPRRSAGFEASQTVHANKAG